MPQHIIHIAIFFAFYIIGAFSTTDILRLSSGSTVPISNRNCYCAACGYKIPLYDQIPIFSYLFRHGKCRFCGSMIPRSELFLELFLFFSLSALSAISRFSYGGLFLCFFIYQSVKFIYLLKFGFQNHNRRKIFLSSLFHDIVLFGLLTVLFFLEHLIF